MPQESKYPVRLFRETPYEVKNHMDIVKDKEYGIIFSVFNRLDITKQTLPVLIEETKDIAEIIVVNDGSTDGTTEWLTTVNDKEQNITHIWCEKNLGISESQNKAIQLCEHRGYKHIIFHDNDVIMSKGWVQKLRKYLDENEKVGIVSPHLMSKGSGDLEILSEMSSQTQTVTPHFTPTVNMTKAEIFKDVGHWDENFIGFGSQCVDFAMRVYLAGWRGYKISWVVGTHFAHATVGVGFSRGWWNDKEMTNHNIKAWMAKWHERFNNSRSFLAWTAEKVKELHNDEWLIAN